MSDAISLAQRVTNLDVSPRFDNYSKVVIKISDDEAITVGNDTGRTLEIDNPFGTRAMAENILESLEGFQYQPYEADGAILDPRAEIGDAVNVRGTYGGIYTRSRLFTRLMKADISAPHDEEINHEYQFESPTDRKFTRQINDVKASLIVANNEISAKVSKTSPDGQTSFSWSLDSESHTWYANGTEVMRVSASGLMIKGEVQATSGKIGGFTIGNSAIYNGISSMGSSSSSGVYLGTDGIRLGSNFRVDTGGYVTAQNIDLKGQVNFLYSNGNYAGYMSAANLFAGANGYNNAVNSSSGSYPSYFKVSGPLYCKNLYFSESNSKLYDANSVSHTPEWAYLNVGGSYRYVLVGS